jgi:cobalt/nickel transport system permease protein
MRSLSSISILYALILNTSISDILYVLRSIKIPEIMLDIMVLVYRNIFIFSDTAKSIYTSQKSRLGYRNFRSAMVSSGKLGGRIFVLAEVKAEHLFQSMESRCYNGKINTLPGEWEINKPFILIALGVLVFLSTGLFYV